VVLARCEPRNPDLQCVLNDALYSKLSTAYCHLAAVAAPRVAAKAPRAARAGRN